MGRESGGNLENGTFKRLMRHDSFIGNFTKTHLETISHSFKVTDCCSDFSVSIPYTEKGPGGCQSTFARFEIVNQRGVYKAYGLKSTSVILVTISCGYKDSENRKQKIAFIVAVDFDVNHADYFHQISVNSNGSVLMLTSKSACAVANIPSCLQVNQLKFIGDDNFYLFKERVHATLIKTARPSDYNYRLVKTEWHPKFVNCLAILSVESADGEEDEEEEEESSLKLQDDIQSVFKVFNIESSIDVPIFTITLSEVLCRSGTTVAQDNDYALQKGFAVDFCAFQGEKSDWDKFTVYILSNHGFLFVYCPIVLPNCLESFEDKRQIVIAMGKVGDKKSICNTIKSSDDVDALLNSLVIGGLQNDKTTIAEPIVIKLDMGDRYANTPSPIFDSFALLWSDFEITLAVSGLQGAILWFKLDDCVLPPVGSIKSSVSNFSCYCVAMYRPLEICDRHVTVEMISENKCLVSCTRNIILLGIDGSIARIHDGQFAVDGSKLFCSKPTMLCSLQTRFCSPFSNAGLQPCDNGFSLVYGVLENSNLHGCLRVYCICDVTLDLNDAIQPDVPIATDVTFGFDNSFTISDTRTTVGLPAAPQVGTRVYQHISNCQEEFQKALGDIRATLRKPVDGISFKNKVTRLVENVSVIDSAVLWNLHNIGGYYTSVEKHVETHKGVNGKLSSRFTLCPDYKGKLQQFKREIDVLKANTIKIQEQYKRISQMKLDMQEIIALDNAGNVISNVLVQTCIFVVNKIQNVLVPSIGKEGGFEERVDVLIADWFIKECKKNVDGMIEILVKIQKLKGRLYEIY